MRLELGKRVRCADGAVRELADVVIDAGSQRVTHLVVEPQNDPESARLVPVGLAAAAATDQEIALRCTAQSLAQLDAVREHAYLGPGEETEEGDHWDVGVRDMELTPAYMPTALGEFGTPLDQDRFVTYDRVPTGEIELRHASGVYSADGHHLGRVDGVVVDAEARITHLLLDRGHLWWRREIPVPAGAVAEFATDTVTLGITKGELGALPKAREA
jgi:sporulation protein YlmC with PRC-barrel domain